MPAGASADGAADLSAGPRSSPCAPTDKINHLVGFAGRFRSKVILHGERISGLARSEIKMIRRSANAMFE